MTKTKSTKRALLSAILALIMTVSMLVGTTFAWFTDSVTSSGNKIVAGNLDVKLHMYIGDKYVDISDSTLPIFGEGGLIDTYEDVSTLWEPGKTQVVYLAIENAGSLALKYKVSLNVTDIQENLNDVLYYTITPDVDATAGKLTAWDGANALQVTAGEQIVSGTEDEAFVSMTPGAWHYFALSVHMDEQAGNEYMDGSVTFDLSVLATQVEYEADSFGDDYDGGLGDYTLNLGGNVTEKGVVQESADGSKIFYSEETTRVQLMAIPKDVEEEYAVPYGVTHLGNALQGNTEIKELTIPETVVYAQKALDGATFDKVILEEGLETIPNRLFYKTNVETVEIPESVTTIEQSAFAQAKLETLTIPASVEIIEQQAFSYMPELTSVVIESGATIPYYAFRACPKLKVVVIEGEVDIYNAGTTISNTEAGGRHDMQFYVTSESMAQKVKDICGAQRPDANYANKNTYTVTVVEKVSDGFYKESGKSTTFFASSAEGIASFSDWRNSTAPVEGSGLYSAWMTLLCDVDMSGVEYTPFVCYFTSFDGNGYTISNLDAGQGMSGKSGFVSYAGGGRIMNLTLENVTVEGCQAGLFVGGSEGLKIENCFVAGDNKVIWSQNTTSSYVEEWSAVGAIAGYNVQGSFDVTILPGAKIAVYEMDMVTNATKVNTYIGAGADNSLAGGIKNNGTVGIVATSNVADNDQAGFDSAVASSSIVEVILGEGNYTLPQTNGKDVSIVGTKDTVIDVTAGHYADNGSLYLQGVTIKGGVGMSGPDYAAIYSPDAVFVNCYFDGGFRVGRDGATFIGCTFDLTTTSSTGMEYVWTYGNDVIFDDCTFNTSGKAILVYKDGGNEVSKVTVKNCEFYADQGAKAGAIANQNCAAIEIDNRGCGVELTLQGNTVDSKFSGEWRIKDAPTANPMIINGVAYTTIAIDGKLMTIDASKNVTVID